jgi:hypothetical protein
MPIFLILISLYGKMARGHAIAKMGAVAKLGGFTEETLGAIKLVVAFG